MRESPGAAPAAQSLAQELKRDFPDLRQMASSYIKGEIKSRAGIDLDPDKTYLHRFINAESDGRALTGWTHDGPPTRSQTLTDTVLSNFGPHNRRQPGDLNALAGVYSEGPSAKHFGVHNEVRIRPSEIMDIVWDGDFSRTARRSLDTFWGKNQDRYRAAVKGAYLASAVKQRNDRKLSDEGFQLALEASGTGSANPAYAPLADLHASPPLRSDIRISALNINGSTASDILQIERGGKKLLYVPGSDQPFHEFASLQVRNNWVAAQGGDDLRRRELASHFSLYDRQDGFTSGVDSSLKQLGDGTLSRSRILAPPLNLGVDPFTQVAAAQRARSLSDADTSIKSDSEVTRESWLSDLSAFSRTFGLMAPLSPIVGGATAALGLARTGLGIDQAINGDTAEERKDGLAHAAWGAIDAATLFDAARAGGDADGVRSVAKEAETGPPSFNPPKQVNGRYGYPLGPDSAPKLPRMEAGDRSGHWELPILSSDDVERELHLPETEARGHDMSGVETADGPHRNPQPNPTQADANAGHEHFDADDFLSDFNRYQPQEPPVERPGGQDHPPKRPRMEADDGSGRGERPVLPHDNTMSVLGPYVNETWSTAKLRGFGKISGGHADCGQHAAGDVGGPYRVGSVDPKGGVDQSPEIRTPFGFNRDHGLDAATFRKAKIPANAQGVAYVNVQTGKFHYAKFSGKSLTHTDANRAGDPGMGGTFHAFRPGLGEKPSLNTPRAVTSMQPVSKLKDLDAFVKYCAKHYGLAAGFFFFCRFA